MSRVMTLGDKDDNNMDTASGQSKIFANASASAPMLGWPRYSGISIQFHAESAFVISGLRPQTCATGPSGWKY